MNRIYSVVWSYAKKTYVVAFEFAKATGKNSCKKLSVSNGFMLLLLAVAYPATALGSDQINSLPEKESLFVNKQDKSILYVKSDEEASEELLETELYAISPRLGLNAYEAGPQSKANAENSLALGKESTVSSSAQGAVAVGNKNTIGNNSGSSLAVGGFNTVNINFGTAVGYSNSVSGRYATALGSQNTVSGVNGLTIGYLNTVTGEDGIAMGSNIYSSGANSVLLGEGLWYSGKNGVIIGDGRDGSLKTMYQGDAIVVIGDHAFAGANSAIAIGTNASAKGLNSIAIGQGAKVTYANSVALGAGSQATKSNSLAIGGAGNTRVIEWVSEGDLSSGSKEAVNGSQLFATNERVTKNEEEVLKAQESVKDFGDQITQNTTNINKNATEIAKGLTFAGDSGNHNFKLGDTINLKGNAASDKVLVDGNIGVNVDSATGNISVKLAKDLDLSSAGSLKVGNTTVNNSGINIIDETTGEILTQFSDEGLVIKNGPTVTQNGINAGNKVISNVANGDLSENSKEAVNGSQLFATNAKVTENSNNITNLDKRVTTNEGNITNLGDRITTNEGNITKLGDKITNITDGKSGVIQLSSDGTSLVVDNTLGEKATVLDLSNGNSTRKVTGVTEGLLSADSTDAVNGSQLFATNAKVTENSNNITNLDKRVTTNEGNITNLGDRITTNEGNITKLGDKITNITDGKSGVIQLSSDGTSLVVDNTLGEKATVLDLSNGNSTRKVTGVTEGLLSADSTDAVNGSQLFATNAKVTENSNNITNLDKRVTTNEGNITQLGDRITTNEGNITKLGDKITNITDGKSGVIQLSSDGTSLVVDNTLGEKATVLDLSNGNSTREVTGVTEGLLSADSTDAVNGSQLFATNAKVTENSNNITDLDNKITNISGGKSGVIQLSSDGKSLVVDNTLAVNATVLDLSNGNSTRKVTGVTEGLLSADSTDAVNGSQLFATNAKVTENSNNITNLDKRVTTNEGNITNLGDRITTNEGNITQLGDRITTNEGNITKLGDKITNITDGKSGVIQLSSDGTSLVVDNTLGEKATVLDLSNGNSTRKVTGVTEGLLSADSTDAVNGSQLFATNAKVTENSNNITDLDNKITNISGGKSGVIQLSSDGKSLVVDNTLAVNATVLDLSNSSNGSGRKLTGVLAGTADADAVNVSQLKPVIAGLGGGAKIDDNGTVIGPNYNEALGLGEGAAPVTTVDGGLKYVNDQVTNVKDVIGGEVGEDGKWTIDLGKNEDGSSKTITGAITDNTNSINDINSKVSGGKLGLVQLGTSGQIVIDNEVEGVDGAVFNFANSNGSGRKLTGVLAGTADADAVNVSQLKPVIAGLGGGAKIDDNGTVTGPNYNEALGLGEGAAPVTTVDGGLKYVNDQVTNVKDVIGGEVGEDGKWTIDLGKNEDGSSKTITGAITDNTNSINDINSKVSGGKLGLVQLGASGQIVIDNEVEGVDGAVFNFANSNGSGRKLTGILAGTADADAVNVSQLKPVIAGLGGGAKINDNGTVTGPNYNEALGLEEGAAPVTTVDGGLKYVNDQVTNVKDVIGGEVGEDGKWTIDLGKNEDGSSKTITGAITDNTNSINDINSKVSGGKLGLVQLSDNGKELVIDNAVAKDATEFNFAGVNDKGEPVTRKLTGVSEGLISADSKDAINGSQLYSANEKIGSVLGGDAGYAKDPETGDIVLDENGNPIWRGPSYQFSGEGNTFNTIGGAFDHVSSKIDGLESGLKSVTDGTSGIFILGGSGQGNPNEIVINNNYNNNTVLNVSGKDNDGNDFDRTITGVKDGAINKGSSDAINGSQLHGVSESIASALGGGAGVKEDGSITKPTYTFTDKNGKETSVDNIGGAFNHVNDQIVDLDNRVDKNTNDISSIKDIIGGTSDQDGNWIKPDLGKNSDGKDNTIVDIVEGVTKGTSGIVKVDGDNVVLDQGVTGNKDFNISGTDGDRTLTGVKDGTISEGSSDAINGGQLFDYSTAVGNMIGGGATYDSKTNSFKYNSDSAIGKYGSVDDAIKSLDENQMFTSGKAVVFDANGETSEKDAIVVNSNNNATVVNFANGDVARKVTGVADGYIGQGSTEAVNGGQLHAVKEEIQSINYTMNHYNTRMNTIEKKVHENRKVASAGIAGAMAMSSIPYVEYSKYSFGMGIGYYDGESAISLGFQGKISDRTYYRLQMSYDTQNKVGLGAGVAFEF